MICLICFVGFMIFISTAKSLFTSGFRIVLVFAILTIGPLISESLLGNTRVTMETIWAPFHKKLVQYH